MFKEGVKEDDRRNKKDVEDRRRGEKIAHYCSKKKDATAQRQRRI
jgi:hypothetical protein